MAHPQSFLVCQHLTCRKQGAAQVLGAFRSIAPKSSDGTGCLGRCGSGPNVLVVPSQTWYHRVQPEQVLQIVADLPEVDGT
jgi:NADH:ubiquinone oxidoreductase subunit E